MKKRLLTAFVLLSLLVSLSGCAGIFKKEYLSVTEYKDDGQNSSDSDVMHISEYAELKDAVSSLINNHKTEGRLRFTNYDGTIQGDLSQALIEVKEQNALASFAVDYMSYDLSRIVTYYEAVVYITYKRAQSEIDKIEYVSGRSELQRAMSPALDNMEPYIALRMTSSTITAGDIVSDVVAVYAKNPASCVVSPSVKVTLHPETGLQRIVEIELEYGWKLSELQKMKSSLSEKIEKLSSDVSSTDAQSAALNLFVLLSRACSYDPTGSLRSSKAELDTGLGSTAYGALVEGYADSKGMAAAYSALCYKLGIECTMVEGTKDGESHCWNIIKLNDHYYHADVSAYYSSGAVRSFMQTDEQMKASYVWDNSKYPVCGAPEPEDTKKPS